MDGRHNCFHHVESVQNNTNLDPINCAFVMISLSLDGGNTFPLLLSYAQNDGSQEVFLPPEIYTTEGRIKVQALGNIFFDISDTNLTILPGNNCPIASGNPDPSIGNVGSSVEITGVNFTGVTGVRFSGGVDAAFSVVNDNRIIANVPVGAVSGPITISKSDCSNKQTAVFTVTPCAPSPLTVDDGSVESFWGYGSGIPTSVWVNRLTPQSYPATLTHVSIYFDIPAGI